MTDDFHSYLEKEGDGRYYKMNTLAYYYEELSKKKKELDALIQQVKAGDSVIVERLEEVDDTLTQRLAEWDGKIESFPDDVTTLLGTWATNGTLDSVIQTSIVDEKLHPVVAQLAETATNLSFAEAKNKTLSVYGASDPRYLDNIGDGFIYGSNSRKLYRTNTENGTWTLIKDFGTGDAVNGIRKLGDGEVLVIRSTDGLWKSNGWANNPLTATWTQVLVTNGRVSQFSFDVDPISGWVTATTYINGDMTNARYVWLSKDNASTFTEIFDMLDYEPTINKTHSHLHIAVIDRYHNPTTPRIWISYHKTADDPTNTATPLKRIKYSDDAGVTWVDFSNANYQPIVGVATPEGMIFASDEEVVGLYIVRRTTNPADMKYELFYAIRENIDGIFGWGTKVIKGINGAYHFAFRSSVASYPARVISTDGKTVAETLKIPPATVTDAVDLVDILEFNGRLLGTYYNTATGAGNAYKLAADSPARGVSADTKVGALDGGAAGALGTAAGYNARADMRGTAVGSNSNAARRSTVIGEQSASGIDGVAIGSETKVTTNGTAVGFNAKAAEGVSAGRLANTTGDGTAVGTNAKAIHESIAVGSFPEANFPQSIAIGRVAKVNKDFGIALGAQTEVTGTGGVAIGRQAKALHDFSVALGYGAQTTYANQWKVGSKHIEIATMSTPPAPPANNSRIFARMNGTGKMEIVVMFPSGATTVIATEP